MRKSLQGSLHMIAAALVFLLAAMYAPWLVWAALVPILLLNAREQKWKKAFVHSVFFSVGVASVIGYWVVVYSIKVALLMIGAFSSFLLLFLLLSRMAMRMKSPLRLALPPIVWVGLQFIYSFSAADSYWATLSLLQPMTAPLIYVIGAKGMTALIVLANVLGADMLLKKKWKNAVVLGGILLLVGASYLYSNAAQIQGSPVRVALIQGNIHGDFQWRMEHKEEIIEKYYQLTKKVEQKKPELIVWPEYAVVEDVHQNQDVLDRLKGISREMNATLVVGTVEWLPGTTKGIANRKDVATIITPGGEVDSYQAVQPLPFEAWTFPGHEVGVKNIDGRFVGITMCYEETQEEIMKMYSERNIPVVISLANNFLFTWSPMALRFSSLFTQSGASANHLYVLRATNTGITQIVNPNGKKVAELPPNREGVVIADIFV